MIDCPSINYVNSLLEVEDFKKHQKFATHETDIASIVIHFTPKNVMDHPKYDFLLFSSFINFIGIVFFFFLDTKNGWKDFLKVHNT